MGLVEGGLLPWACRGLACLFTAVVLMYGAGLVVGWGVIGVIVHLTRQRWPTSTLRTWVLRGLATISWAVALYPIVVLLE